MIQSDSRHSLLREKERRNSPRLSINPLVYLSIVPDNGGLLLDLGEEGMCISVANPLVLYTEVRFSLAFKEHRIVQGTGRVCWLSETGRKAGVQFIGLPGDLSEFIRQWLGIEDAPKKGSQGLPAPAEAGSRANQEQDRGASSWPERPKAGGNPVAQTTAAVIGQAETNIDFGASSQERRPPSAFTLFSPPPPRPAAIPSGESPLNHIDKEPSPCPEAPYASLMFLPRKRETEDLSPSGFSEPLQPALGEREKHLGEDDSGASSAVRSAIVSGSRSALRPVTKKSALRKALVVMAVCATLIVAGLLLHSFPGTFHGLPWTAPAAAVPRIIPEPALRTVGSEGFKPKVRSPRVSSLRDREGLAVGNDTTFYPTNQNPLTGERPITASGYPAISAGHSVSAAPSASSFGSSLQIEGLMPGVLRNDGALVEEGVRSSTSPIFGNQAAPIVVEAVIGKDGAVTDVRLIRSPASKLAAAIVAAVKHWRYRPLYENGQPVGFTTRITFHFTRPGHK